MSIAEQEMEPDAVSFEGLLDEAAIGGRVFGAGARRPVLVPPPADAAPAAGPGKVRLGRVGDKARGDGDLSEMVARIRPDGAAAHERTLPVADALSSLVPGGALVRGTVWGVTASPGVDGATSLALALVAASSGSGSWCAAVGVPSLGWLAAAGLGLSLDRCLAVATPPVGEWATVVAALVDSVDLIIVPVPARFSPGDDHRLRARARERGAILVGLGGSWPEAPDGALTVTRSRWEGLGQGHGHLTGRRVTVVRAGRRQASRPHRVDLWLPHPDGGIRLA